MRISDWSSDVCSSDLVRRHLVPAGRDVAHQLRKALRDPAEDEERRLDVGALETFEQHLGVDRKSVVSGRSVSVRVDLGGRRLIKKKKNIRHKEIETK